MTLNYNLCTLKSSEVDMKLSGLHILLTYQCIYECEHCFVWGGPGQKGVLAIKQVEQILLQARQAGVTSIYFEGGEPFLYYAVLVMGVRKAAELGFLVGIVSNAYWAVSIADALESLQPFAGRLADLTVSSDLYHCEKVLGEQAQNALAAAKWMNIPTALISIDNRIPVQLKPMDRSRVKARSCFGDAQRSCWLPLPHLPCAIPGRNSLNVLTRICANPVVFT